MQPRHARLRFVLLVVLTAGSGGLALAANLCGWLDADDIRALVAAGGVWSPLVYVVVASLLLLAWFPRSLLSVVAGALFGVGLGTALALVMGTAGALGGYALGVKLGNPYLALRTESERSRRIVELIRRRGFWAVLGCRVCPLVPCELISVTSGVTAIPLSRFVPASLVGMTPGAFLSAALGASLLAPDGLATTLAAAGGFVVLTLVTGTFLVRLWRKDRAA
jgi:uncharacterized membrane protein YdjX (TVP38/TMEM64 family)